MSEKIRILVTDDHIVVRKGLVAMLETEPEIQIVGEASNGAEAVKMAQELLPDVVLMDLVMPVMDGIEAIQRIRKTHSKETLPILLFTADSSEEETNTEVFADINGIIAKPVIYEKLVDTLGRVIKR